MGVASASAPRRCFRRAEAGPAIWGRGFARYLAISLAAHGGWTKVLRPPPSALPAGARGWQAVGRGPSICDRRGARQPPGCNCGRGRQSAGRDWVTSDMRQERRLACLAFVLAGSRRCSAGGRSGNVDMRQARRPAGPRWTWPMVAGGGSLETSDMRQVQRLAGAAFVLAGCRPRLGEQGALIRGRRQARRPTGPALPFSARS